MNRLSPIGLVAAFAALSIAWDAPSARAQDTAARHAAARAYQAGQQAQLRGDTEEAARLFELAYRSAPAPAALRSAIRMHEASGAHARAATLALRAVTEYPADRETRELAQEVIDRHAPTLGRLRVRCDRPCALAVDGHFVGLEASTRFEIYVSAGEHTVEAAWEGYPNATQRLEAGAGEILPLSFTRPAAAALPDETPDEPAPIDDHDPALTGTADEGGDAMRPLFFASLGVAGALAAVSVWSITDTLDARDAYEAAPTREGLNSGEKKERRMWGFVGGTVAAGVAAAAFGAMMGDEDGEPATTVVVEPRRGGATAAVIHRF